MAGAFRRANRLADIIGEYLETDGETELMAGENIVGILTEPLRQFRREVIHAEAVRFGLTADQFLSQNCEIRQSVEQDIRRAIDSAMSCPLILTTSINLEPRIFLIQDDKIEEADPFAAIGSGFSLRPQS